MRDDRPPQFPASSIAALLGGVCGAVSFGTVVVAVIAWIWRGRTGWDGAFDVLIGSAILGVFVAVPGAVAGLFGAGIARRFRVRVHADWPSTLTDFAGAFLAGSALTASFAVVSLL